MPRAPTDYDEVTDYEDARPPESVRKGLPADLKDAKIKGGETHPADATIRLNGPPGTGKTTQMCLRVAVLIEEHNIDPRDITIMTYRRSLAGEIEARLKSWGILDEEDELEMWTTAHAAANRVTGLLSGRHDENTDSGLGPAVTGYEKWYFCSEVLDIKYSSAPWSTSRGELLFKVIEYARDNLLDPADKSDLYEVPKYTDLKEEWPGVDVPQIYERWEAFKQEAGLTEFGELLEAAVNGPLPPTKAVVVDEYHDVTPLMAQVCERWVAAADTAIVAGDPLQVVNEYTGADPRFFSDRLDHIPEVLLTKTWRVPRSHWQAATLMLSKEFDEPPVTRDSRGELHEYKSPWFEKGDSDGWRVPGADTPASPGALVQDHIDGHDDRSMMLLARSRTQVSGISAALEKAGIIHSTHDSDLGGWTQRRVDLLNALVKLRGVPATYASDDGQYGLQTYDTDASQLRLTGDEAATLLEHTNGRVLSVTNDERETFISGLRDGEQTVTADDLGEVVKDAFWGRYTSGTASVSELTKSGELDDGEIDALQAAVSERDETVAEDAVKRVRVLTIHASKGSEASDVVVYDGITSTIASEIDRLKRKSENEARTWYVALTRASERLHIMRGGFRWMTPYLDGEIVRKSEQAAERAAANAESAEDDGDELPVIDTPAVEEEPAPDAMENTGPDPAPTTGTSSVLGERERVDNAVRQACTDGGVDTDAATGRVAKRTRADLDMIQDRIEAYQERMEYTRELTREVCSEIYNGGISTMTEVIDACESRGFRRENVEAVLDALINAGTVAEKDGGFVGLTWGDC
ncbi:UvrD-helicase domain-containing protein [Halostella litorea]|uniref:UvrD-helicase domain-containing protein n=1 Tax=Halostella litorea TaxID=2528831 RepID=UPI001091AA6A|nr:UvrD-helicase domain-containing protein [Halostella litorea]